ncbi:MAG TPA: T9SS type A sorting domain-containing protein [Bacteroidia bacterium]|nr:T9SS type A sorting domain-containing protein [Bacteroidia bacterium]
MKNVLLSAILALCVIAPVQATVITSQANGNATNPLTWDCLCIPLDGDTIVINHAITLDVDYAYTMGGIIVNAGGSVTGDANNRIFGVSGGMFMNYGIISIAYIYQNAGSFWNYGSITATRNAGVDLNATMVNAGTLNVNDTFLVNTFATFQNSGFMSSPEIGNAGTITNTGSIVCDNWWNTGTATHTAGSIQLLMSMYNSGNVTFSAPTTIAQDILNVGNITATYYVSARSLFNGDSLNGSAIFTNNAVISLSQDLMNTETITGNGSFCVADSTINTSSVTGTLDICDLSGGNWDVNIGTVAGTVTYCSGSCTIGIAETESEGISLVPNPASEYVIINMPVPANGIVRVLDITGRVVIEEPAAQKTELNISGLAPGIYSVIVITEENSWEEKMVIE